MRSHRNVVVEQHRRPCQSHSVARDFCTPDLLRPREAQPVIPHSPWPVVRRCQRAPGPSLDGDLERSIESPLCSRRRRSAGRSGPRALANWCPCRGTRIAAASPDRACARARQRPDSRLIEERVESLGLNLAGHLHVASWRSSSRALAPRRAYPSRTRSLTACMSPLPFNGTQRPSLSYLDEERYFSSEASASFTCRMRGSSPAPPSSSAYQQREPTLPTPTTLRAASTSW